MSVGEEGLVVDLNEKDMGANSNRIELHEIEEDIRNNKEVWVCLWEGGIFPFMECIEGFDEHVSMQFVDLGIMERSILMGSYSKSWKS